MPGVPAPASVLSRRYRGVGIAYSASCARRSGNVAIAGKAYVAGAAVSCCPRGPKVVARPCHESQRTSLSLSLSLSLPPSLPLSPPSEPSSILLSCGLAS
jgi:hypothetical protein